MGRIFAHLGRYYGWASPSYLLNQMTLSQIFMYYDYLGEMITGKPAGDKKHKPDLKKFRKIHGNKPYYKSPK